MVFYNFTYNEKLRHILYKAIMYDTDEEKMVKNGSHAFKTKLVLVTFK